MEDTFLLGFFIYMFEHFRKYKNIDAILGALLFRRLSL